MSKCCKRCGHLNGDEHFFCQQCGEALDDNVRLIMNYEKTKKNASHATQAPPRRDRDDDYVPVKREPKKKSHAAVWVAVVCVVVVVAVAAYFLLIR